MRTALIVLVVAGLWSAGINARTQEGVTPSTEAAPPASKDKEDERLICTREKTIGSNRTTRVCRTQAQIREQSREAQDSLMRNSSVPSPAGN
ncbi:hypothetical protein LDO26_12330 [Luteimonas sp. BDR2-5]|uniref:hypothetical protein n=1 Tax=Proluteimonas luteida TaxID=2878685 RepID=UPI001E2BE1AB|nr:hypothetical protein [Luteimonas sp. BDR2-5]MCD9028987.1 hypothetical protein [Luteimonas sp. BDR2-5]